MNENTSIVLMTGMVVALVAWMMWLASKDGGS